MSEKSNHPLGIDVYKNAKQPVHDPNGPPQPVDSSSLGWQIASYGLAAIIASGGFFYLTGAFTTSCRGATRSTKLEWERRTQLIQQAALEDSAQRLSDTKVVNDSNLDE